MAIVNFLYVGESNVCHENLDSFLAIASELQLRGLTSQTIEEENPRNEQQPITDKQVNRLRKPTKPFNLIGLFT